MYNAISGHGVQVSAGKRQHAVAELWHVY
jgi:hypothetical protein